MKYKGYKILRVKYKGCDNYKVVPPDGPAWEDLAYSLELAKKWVDVDSSILYAEHSKRTHLDI